MLKILTILAAIATAGIAQAQEGNPMTEDQKAVVAVIDRMTEAFQKGDIDAVMGTYEDTATIMFEPGKPVTGPAVLREMFQGMAAANPQFEFGDKEVIVTGDIAVHSTPWSMQGTAPDGTKIEQSGLSFAVLRRQSDGNWLMVIDNPHGQRLLQN